ncbi:TetR/AcrR family transcriptional regulator [Aliarcobacter lanthieri]|uniref:TetR/AcrR family transcriptional regulator n=1 Tax=Arcobacteraceae TaxID=2808963 RepID=UPI000DEA9F01|nr:MULTISPECIES: TetR/AcrR family transcriptional regulator [Arcobacteraceae]MBL3519146.1 TetR/AcrR family transcriptional regulator [Aliarcobacter lanthieri]RBQ26556.1 TetR family transcriptional regulator [Arcobacter sp. CECT 9188]
MSTKNKIDKDELISIIEDIILEEGISGLSIRKVAAKANISIGGVQYIFGNKEGMIKAISSKNEEEYNHQIELLSNGDDSKDAKIKAHIEYISNYKNNEQFNKSSKMVTMLLQDEFILKEFQDWYRVSLNSIDTNNDEGKKLRLAFLFSEALFALLSLKYIKLSEEERKEILEDLKNFLL